MRSSEELRGAESGRRARAALDPQRKRPRERTGGYAPSDGSGSTAQPQPPPTSGDSRDSRGADASSLERIARSRARPAVSSGQASRDRRPRTATGRAAPPAAIAAPSTSGDLGEGGQVGVGDADPNRERPATAVRPPAWAAGSQARRGRRSHATCALGRRRTMVSKRDCGSENESEMSTTVTAAKQA